MKLYLPTQTEIKPDKQTRIPARERIELEHKKGLILRCGSCGEKILDNYMVSVDITINGYGKRYVVHEKCADKNVKIEKDCQICNTRLPHYPFNNCLSDSEDLKTKMHIRI